MQPSAAEAVLFHPQIQVSNATEFFDFPENFRSFPSPKKLPVPHKERGTNNLVI